MFFIINLPSSNYFQIPVVFRHQMTKNLTRKTTFLFFSFFKVQSFSYCFYYFLLVIISRLRFYSFPPVILLWGGFRWVWEEMDPNSNSRLYTMRPTEYSYNNGIEPLQGLCLTGPFLEKLQFVSPCSVLYIPWKVQLSIVNCSRNTSLFLPPC